MDGREHKHYMRTVEAMKAALRGAQDLREQYAWIEPDTNAPAWMRFELLIMYWTVNRLRTSNGDAAVSLDDVRAADQMASGHIDYFEKFALYCAELAWGLRDRNP